MAISSGAPSARIGYDLEPFEQCEGERALLGLALFVEEVALEKYGATTRF
jgi:hypothetical protein